MIDIQILKTLLNEILFIRINTKLITFINSNS